MRAPTHASCTRSKKPGLEGVLEGVQDRDRGSKCSRKRQRATEEKSSRSSVMLRRHARAQAQKRTSGIFTRSPGPRRGCACRKPAPGMLLTAAREHQVDLTASWIIGDSEIDVEAGRNAGCRTVRLLAGNDPAKGSADAVAPSLLEAIYQILQREEAIAQGRATGIERVAPGSRLSPG